MMNRTQIKISSTDLASRSSARELRNEILIKLKENHSVLLDLSAVKSISDSFADELFGILSAKLGLEAFLSQVKLAGSSDNLNRIIAKNIKNRITHPIAA